MQFAVDETIRKALNVFWKIKRNHTAKTEGLLTDVTMSDE